MKANEPAGLTIEVAAANNAHRKHYRIRACDRISSLVEWIRFDRRGDGSHLAEGERSWTYRCSTSLIAQTSGRMVITEALQHCRGVGPIRLRQLHEDGIRSWHDALNSAQSIHSSVRHDVIQECVRCEQALNEGNIGYFIDNLHAQDRWRILSHFHDRATFFDIETTGLEYDSTMTVIVCWHRNALLTFVENENLDDFLDLLDDVDLLVSFNGSTFDVPRVRDGFHIPEIPCPHLDLRWPCYHQNLSGGLKKITSRLGLERPADLQDVDGELAVRLWQMWESSQNADARNQLIRYCAADVLLLRPLAQHLAGNEMMSAEELWQSLPAASPLPAAEGRVQERHQELKRKFGSASPNVLRTLRRRSR